MPKLFGINFYNGNSEGIIKIIKRKSVFLVAPSGPGLSEIDKNQKYYSAIRNADYALFDSGLLVLLLNIIGHKYKKLSGPKFLKSFLEDPELQDQDAIFTVDPTKEHSESNRKYLNSIGVSITADYQYVAPNYIPESINDVALISRLNNLFPRPKYILINIGGGVQEQLGDYINQRCSYPISILCTGAAIAIINGDQSPIPSRIDNAFLGWFYRIIHEPRTFFPRYFKAFRLLWLFMRFKNQINNVLVMRKPVINMK